MLSPCCSISGTQEKRQVQTAVDTRTVDTTFLFKVTLGLVMLRIVELTRTHLKNQISYPLNSRLKQYYSLHLYQARARLDVPTFDDEAVQRQLEAASHMNGQSVAWTTLTGVFSLVSIILQVVSSAGVMWSVLRDQPDGPLMAALASIQSMRDIFHWQTRESRGGSFHPFYLSFFRV